MPGRPAHLLVRLDYASVQGDGVVSDGGQAAVGQQGKHCNTAYALDLGQHLLQVRLIGAVKRDGDKDAVDDRVDARALCVRLHSVDAEVYADAKPAHRLGLQTDCHVRMEI